MYATIEEAWGIPEQVKATRTAAPATMARAVAVARDPAPVEQSDAADAAKVREYLSSVYNSTGVGGILALMTPSMVAGVKGAPEKRGSKNGLWDWWARFVRDPEKVLLVVVILFAIFVFTDIGRGGSPAPTGFPAPLAW